MDLDDNDVLKEGGQHMPPQNITVGAQDTPRQNMLHRHINYFEL